MCLSTDRDDPLVQAVAARARADAFLPAGAGVVVAVSAGLDSVCLLHILAALARRPEHAWRLTVAHLDHGLRPDSPADAAFVADLAAGMNLPCVTRRREIPPSADGTVPEALARDVRYAFLAEVAREAGAGFVAVAHHADDQAETVLQRLLRGAHLRGLAGMPARRPLVAQSMGAGRGGNVGESDGKSQSGGAGDTDVFLVRPLLSVRRTELEAYAQRHGLTWREDASNRDTRLQRNFIRHEVLPLLRTRAADIDETLVRLARAAAKAEAYLAEQADATIQKIARGQSDGVLRVAAKELAALHPLEARYVVRTVLERVGAAMDGIGAEGLGAVANLAAADPPAATDLAGGVRAWREGDGLLIGPPPAAAPTAVVSTTPLVCPGRTPLPDGQIVVCKLQPFDGDAFAAHCLRTDRREEWLDADALQGTLTVRSRQDGDAFLPLGAPGTQTVSDLLTNRKVPPAQRALALCVLDEAGVVYLTGQQIADRAKITSATRRVLRVRVR